MEMLHQYVAALQLLSWHSLLFMTIGVAFGIVVGAIPGLTVTLGVIIALPFSFTMDPVTAILFLVAIYKAGNFGGSISAILIGTPGVAAASATVLDGYSLKKQGKAGKALNVAIYSSVIADVLSNLSLILFAGLLASFALRFGPPEFCALIFFSLTIIAGVSGASLIRGLMSGVLGLLVATIGVDAILGVSRFSFGNINLMSGFNFLAVIIGLFAIPEIITKFCARRTSWERERSDLGDHRVCWSEFRHLLPTIFKGSIIGVLLGSIPGIGAAPAAFFSYNEAKRSSDKPELFGRGSIEGIAAAESGNNGTCGATLIPLLTLGIPGDITTAVMFGALLMQGLTPGPMLFQDHGDIIYAIFIGIMASSLIMLVLAKFGMKAFIKVSAIKDSILFPIVFVMCVFGTYAVNTSLFDVFIMLGFGLIGFGMRLLRLPPEPFLIGFILSPLFENNLRRSLRMSSGDFSIFFSSPISLCFIILTILSIAFIFRRKLKKTGG